MSRIAGIPRVVLVAPDSFKATHSATAVAEALERGLASAGHPADACPVADGGEGTRDALVAALGGDIRQQTVADPLGRLVSASFAISGPVGIVEMAAASGLGLVDAAERDPVAADTRGTGELILAAVAAGAREVLVGAGGSATTDGGAGAVAAIADGGGLDGARLIVLCDVRTPYEDAARVFGPQKGAGREQVAELTKRLNALARRWPRDPRGVAMTGAAGGLAGGLWAAFDAELVPGAGRVLDAVNFDVRMRRARAVVTGEGTLDEQSLSGKAVSEVATRARQSGVPCHAVVGRRILDAMGARVLDLDRIIEASTLEEIEAAGRELARAL